jgi:hypothetical protein
MLIEIRKPIAGTGDYVRGSRRQFFLDPGMKVEVEDRIAIKWCESGIANPVETEPVREIETTTVSRIERPEAPRPERAQRHVPERATARKPKSKKGRR